MKIYQSTMGLLVLAVLFLGASAPANATCTYHTATNNNIPGETVTGPVGNVNGVCIYDSENSTFHVNGEFGDHDSQTIPGVTSGILVVDSVNGSTINFSVDGVINSEQTGIYGFDTNTYNIDGTINADDTAIDLTDDNTIVINGVLNSLGTGGFNGWGVYVDNGNTITINGDINATAVGVDVGNLNEIIQGADSTITAGEAGHWLVGDTNELIIDGTVNAPTGVYVEGVGNTVILDQNGVINANIGIATGRGNVTVVAGSIIATSIPGVPAVLEVLDDLTTPFIDEFVDAADAIPAKDAIGIRAGSPGSPDTGTVVVLEGGSVTSDHIGIHVNNNHIVDIFGDVHGDKYGVSTDIPDTKGGTFIRVNETGSVTGNVAIRTNGVGNLVSNWGEISGNKAGIHFHGNDYDPAWFAPWVDDSTNQVDYYRALSNRGIIEATGKGIVAVTCAEDDPTCTPMSEIYGVLFHDTVYPDVTNLLLNAGTIRAVAPTDSGLRAVAIKSGIGVETIHNYTGGTIIGDVETGAGNDTVYLYAGSTFEGDLDMGRTEADPGGYDIHNQSGDAAPDFYLDEAGVAVEITDANGATVDHIDQVWTPGVEGHGDERYLIGFGVDGEIDFDVDPVTGKKVVRVQNNPNWQPSDNGASHDILVATLDDPLTTIDESVGGTAYHVEQATDLTYDSGNDGLVLADPVVLNVTNRVPDDIFDNGLDFKNSDKTTAGEMVDGYYGGDVTEVETLLKTGEATWTLGGNVTIDGSVSIGTDGAITTFGTLVQSGALLIDGTLTSGKVHVDGGATIGGSGTIVTDPGLAGGEGGLTLSGLVLYPDRAPYYHVENGSTPEEAAEYRTLNGLPDNFNSEVFVLEDGSSHTNTLFNTLDSAPNYAVLAPGNSTGTLNVVGNFYFKDKETAHSTYLVSGPDDRFTQDPITGANISPPDGINDLVWNDVTMEWDDAGAAGVDLVTQYQDPGHELYGETSFEVGDGVPDFDIGDDPATLEVETDAVFDHSYHNVPTEGREVVTDWGSVYEAELSTDGEHDRLNVTKAFEEGVAPTAVVATMHPATEAIAAIAATEDAPAVAAVPAVAAHTTYGAVPVPDGVVVLGGRLDIQLDRFVLAEPHDDPQNRYDLYGHAGHVYDIVIAEGGVEGVFQDIGFEGGANDGTVFFGTREDGSEIRLPVFKGFLEYMPDRVRITSIPIFQIVGETDNQIAVGRYIDPMAQYGLHQDSLQGAFAALGQSGNVLAALDRMTPEYVDPFNRVALTLSHAVVDTIIDRAYGAHRGVSTNISSVGNGYGSDASAGSSGSGNGFNFWAGGNWNGSDVSNDDGFIEYEYKTLMGYFGAEYLIGDTGMIGAVVSLGNTDMDYGLQRINDGEVDHWSISGYGSYYFGDIAHVTAGGGHGNMDIQAERTDALANHTEAKYDGDYSYFFAEVSSTIDLGNSLSLTPSVDVTHTKIKQDAFAETGDSPFALDVDAQSNKSLRGAVRARLAYDWEPEMGHLIAYATVGVAHEFKDGQHILNARFVGDDGNFTIHGAGFHGTAALVNLGMTAILNEIWAIDASYNGEFGEQYDNHGFSLNVQASF